MQKPIWIRLFRFVNPQENLLDELPNVMAVLQQQGQIMTIEQVELLIRYLIQVTIYGLIPKRVWATVQVDTLETITI